MNNQVMNPKIDKFNKNNKIQKLLVEIKQQKKVLTIALTRISTGTYETTKNKKVQEDHIRDYLLPEFVKSIEKLKGHLKESSIPITNRNKYLNSLLGPYSTFKTKSSEYMLNIHNTGKPNTGIPNTGTPNTGTPNIGNNEINTDNTLETFYNLIAARIKTKIRELQSTIKILRNKSNSIHISTVLINLSVKSTSNKQKKLNYDKQIKLAIEGIKSIVPLEEYFTSKAKEIKGIYENFLKNKKDINKINKRDVKSKCINFFKIFSYLNNYEGNKSANININIKVDGVVIDANYVFTIKEDIKNLIKNFKTKDINISNFKKTFDTTKKDIIFKYNVIEQILRSINSCLNRVASKKILEKKGNKVESSRRRTIVRSNSNIKANLRKILGEEDIMITRIKRNIESLTFNENLLNILIEQWTSIDADSELKKKILEKVNTDITKIGLNKLVNKEKDALTDYFDSLNLLSDKDESIKETLTRHIIQLVDKSTDIKQILILYPTIKTPKNRSIVLAKILYLIKNIKNIKNINNLDNTNNSTILSALNKKKEELERIRANEIERKAKQQRKNNKNKLESNKKRLESNKILISESKTEKDISKLSEIFSVTNLVTEYKIPNFDKMYQFFAKNKELETMFKEKYENTHFLSDYLLFKECKGKSGSNSGSALSAMLRSNGTPSSNDEHLKKYKKMVNMGFRLPQVHHKMMLDGFSANVDKVKGKS
jgi:hypothetical protein